MLTKATNPNSKFKIKSLRFFTISSPNSLSPSKFLSIALSLISVNCFMLKSSKFLGTISSLFLVTSFNLYLFSIIEIQMIN